MLLDGAEKRKRSSVPLVLQKFLIMFFFQITLLCIVGILSDQKEASVLRDQIGRIMNERGKERKCLLVIGLVVLVNRTIRKG